MYDADCSSVYSMLYVYYIIYGDVGEFQRDASSTFGKRTSTVYGIMLNPPTERNSRHDVENFSLFISTLFTSLIYTLFLIHFCYHLLYYFTAATYPLHIFHSPQQISWNQVFKICICAAVYVKFSCLPHTILFWNINYLFFK